MELGKAFDTREVIESGIKSEDSLDSMALHDGHMHSVTCGMFSISQHNLLCVFQNFLINRQYLVYDAQQCIESRLNRVPAINGNIAVQNLLQYLGIGY